MTDSYHIQPVKCTYSYKRILNDGNGAEKEIIIRGFSNHTLYTTFTNFSMKYLLMCNIYTDVSGIK